MQDEHQAWSVVDPFGFDGICLFKEYGTDASIDRTASHTLSRYPFTGSGSTRRGWMHLRSLISEMFNELDGWAVTGAEIVRTNDGGLTWYNVSPPEMTETGYNVDTFFLDNDHAWVQKPDPEKYPNSGMLYRTSDGGRTWENHIVPFSRGDLNFLNAENGWVLADLGVGAGSNAVAVFQTADGGGSWEKTYTNDPNEDDASDTLPLGGIKSDLVPMDENTAWITGVTYAPGEVYLFRTIDQGKSWKQVTLPLPPNAQNYRIGHRSGSTEVCIPGRWLSCAAHVR